MEGRKGVRDGERESYGGMNGWRERVMYRRREGGRRE